MEFLRQFDAGFPVPKSVEKAIETSFNALEDDCDRVTVLSELETDLFESGLDTIPLFHGYNYDPDDENPKDMFHCDLEAAFFEMWREIHDQEELELHILEGKNHCIPARDGLSDLVSSLFDAILNDEDDKAFELKKQVDESIRSSFLQECGLLIPQIKSAKKQ